MTPGELLFWPGHEFDDGGKSDKLQLVLNHQRNGVHLVAYTTSQSRGANAKEGCDRARELFLIKEKTYGFSKNTWIQLFRVREYDVAELESLLARGRTKSLKVIPASLLQAILNCYRDTQSYSDYHDWLLEKP